MRARWEFARQLLAVFGLLASAAAHAGPMGFNGSTMAMGDFSPNWQEAWVNHAISPRDAFGAGVVAMRSDDRRPASQLSRTFSELTYTRLLHRINGEHSQANFWFVGGAGRLTGHNLGDSKTMLAPGVSADYETTRLYVSASVRLYRAPGINHDFVAARAGFSFYEADYDETQPWLVVEARRMRGLSEKTEITPMLRLIHKRYFVELGVSSMRQARANFMYIF
ncbi:MAG: hypothetical protein EAZ34_02475 [Polaromonas sp.]|nr:MAG: hypothetical protein EAZ34_02475 [Polaromonas sp.]